MSKSSQITITLPDEIVIAMQERVASGEYRNESEVILNSLEFLFEHDLSPHDGDPAYEEWLRTEVVASINELSANPSSAISSDELRVRMAQRHAERVAERRK